MNARDVHKVGQTSNETTNKNSDQATEVDADGVKDSNCNDPISPNADSCAVVTSESDGIADIRKMDWKERQALLEGSQIKIILDAKVVDEIPQNIFMVASTNAHELLREHPRHIILPAGTSIQPFEHIFKWLKQEVRSYNIPRKDILVNDLLICRAGRFLGMDLYIEPIHRYYWAYLKNNIPTDREINWVMDFGTTSGNPYFKCMVDHLAWRFRHAPFVRQDELENLIAQKPALEEAIKEINALWDQRKRDKEEGQLRREERKRRIAAKAEREAQQNHKKPAPRRELRESRRSYAPSPQEKIAKMKADAEATRVKEQENRDREERTKNDKIEAVVLRKIHNKIRTFTEEELSLIERRRWQGDERFKL